MTGCQRFCLSLFLFTTVSHAAQYGFNFSTVLAPREISNLKSLQVMFFYNPQRYCYKNFNLYFDGGFGTFWVPHSHHHSHLNILSLAPVLRYSFPSAGKYVFYSELSFGLAYLSGTYMSTRNLGTQFSFQDRLGIGVLIANKVSIGIHMLHYSNAGIAHHNSGFSAPIVLDLGYTFN